VAGEKIQLGLEATRGFGSGGDPELGRSAAEEAATEIRSALEGVEAVFVLAGLGGGTGSGAAPLVAELAREAGALVIAVVTLPFNFEGKRRSMQAADALAALQQQAHAVICFENDRMGNATPPKAGIQMAFTAADQTLSQSVLALAALLNRSGLIHLGFDEIAAVLQTVNARCLFGYGDAEGSNRSYDALAQALKNPLMDKGRMLRDCETVLIQICGGPDLTLDEVQLTMEEFNRHVDNRTRILFGAAVDPGLSGRLTVTILSSLSADQSQAVRPRPLVVPQERVAPVPVAVAPRTRQTPAPAEPTIAAPKEKQPATAEVRDFQTETPVVQETAPTEPVTAPAEPEVFELNAPGVEFAAQAEEPPVEQAPPPPQRPEKPRGLRTATTQISLFGEEPTAPADAPATQEPTAPAPAKITPPVPGRMLRRPFPERSAPQPAPVAEPASLPTPEPEPVPALQAAPEPEAATEVAPEPEPTPEPVIEAVPEPVMEAVPEPEPIPENPVPAPPVFAPRPLVPRVERRPASAPQPHSPELLSAAEMASTAPTSSSKAPQQEVMQFEPVTRGRFEKSEPTIVDGQDLDVPTYLRHRVKLR